MISIYTKIAYSSWSVLFIIWLAGYFTNKRTLRRPELGKYAVTTALLAVSFLLLFASEPPGIFAVSVTPTIGLLGVLGDALCLAGVLFAAAARIVLGRNWAGSVAAVKENHELVQRGPYAWVRHPIYTGFLFGMLGLALTIGSVASYTAVGITLVAFLMRITIEERVMTQEFPEQYAAYRKTAKTLIPFIW